MPNDHFRRRGSARQTQKLFVVATEGKETEKIYLSIFAGEEFRQNIRLKLLPTRHGSNSPRHVLKRLSDYANKEGLEPEDELWVVVDVDRWGEHELDRLCSECARAGYGVAVSNPCFELWLVLHQPQLRAPISAQGCEVELARLFGGRYDKASFDVDVLVPHVITAIRHAKRLDHNPDALWPQETGTRVYKLVERLINRPTSG